MSEELKQKVITAMHNVYDPEIPVNIWEIGLIYEITVDDEHNAHILMTLTSPHCPVAESLPLEVEERAEAVEGIQKATVEITWDPPWDPEMMSEAARLELGFD